MSGLKINSQNSPAQEFTTQQKRILETIKLGNKNNGQDINVLLDTQPQGTP